MSDETLILETTITIKLPKVPNFILLDNEGDGEAKFPVKDLTMQQVEEIGKAWTEALRKKVLRESPLRA